MATYSAILIDDEIHCNESLDLLLKKIGTEIRVIAKFNDAMKALNFLKDQEVDLVFLDIEMPGMNGFELLSNLEKLTFDVIVVTAYDQYAIKAFSYSALNYLLKPVDEEELKETLDKWLQKKDKYLYLDQLSLMQEILNSSAKLKTKVALPTSDGLEFMEIKNIIRCESESNYTWIHCVDDSKTLICRTLKEVEKVLQESGFIRIHHSHLINPAYVRKYIRNQGGYIIMEDAAQISVSRAKKDRLFELFNNVERL